MLKSLFIRNYVLIDELDIRFDDGFSVITGETGAGKSIILGALSLVLGERADTRSILSGSDKCIIEAVFDVSNYNLEAFFAENDIEYDATECLFRRELYNTGKSRAFINDSPVQLSVVKVLGNRLIDVHSQHQNLLLADTHFQLNVVDLMAHTKAKLAGYRKEYDKYQSLSAALNELTEKVRNSKKEEDYIRHQYEELKAAGLKKGEQEEIELELDTLLHTEEIKSSLYKISELLNGDNAAVVASLKESITLVEQISAHYPKAAEYTERLRSAYFDVNDMASETAVLKDDIEFSPERLEWVNQRLNTIYSLQQKHKVASVEELIDMRNYFGAQLDAIESFDEEIAKLTGQQREAYNILIAKADEITALRKEASKTVESRIIENMILLGIPNACFLISFARKEKPAADGIDEICFLFSANKNEPLKPVSTTASGGEISRLMLCVKSMIAGSAALPSIIFDEIDTGVSGVIADKMAGIMRDLGNKMQVITITHLPQIAARGKVHYCVYKEDTAERTLTRIRTLGNDERIEEIAGMLSGATMTQAAIDNARALLSS
ncbi:MAG: DNA repair protein RecN [Tannerella sp.]|jgi:DNA repair protein RecN (Recombination protein N)|nr:DNA repair protein RecN [Tannerella sp.]